MINIALVGNPNTGKTSIFNILTGLNQKVGNYPGVTVNKKEGVCVLSNSIKANIIDLPGTYSLLPKSKDESVVIEYLTDDNSKPDITLVVVEPVNIKRNLFLFSQIKDLKTPVVLVVNMSDRLLKEGIYIDKETLSEQLDCSIVFTSSVKNTGFDDLKKTIIDLSENKKTCISTPVLSRLSEKYPELKKELSTYNNWIEKTNKFSPRNLEEEDEEHKGVQIKETIYRYQHISELLKISLKKDSSKGTGFRARLDKILLHNVFGYLVFFAITALMFQAVFSWSGYPMDLIDSGFADLSSWVASTLSQGILNDLLSEGLIPGIGGVVIFLPQIIVLFLFISILEETGYMSRVVFLMDKIMRKFGMSGKSVIPLISGTACAIPAIMATRNIENWKERLITILITPFTTCSARLPVYAILISLVIPEKTFFGFIGLQGLVLTGLYLLGFLSAIFSGYILNKIIKTKEKSYFVIEMPSYKMPIFKNVFITILEKSKAFVFGAGKIIVSLSIVLWFLASHGGDDFDNVETTVNKEIIGKSFSEEYIANKVSELKLKNSYIGKMGNFIEPAVRPLGYDWKIGIALITSFAAREVFVGTLATIYSVGDADMEGDTIKNRMTKEIRVTTGKPLFDVPTGMSLLIFYVFAMQCIGTLAIVKKETKSWKWPILQLVSMTGIAYISAYITYIIF